MGFFSKTILFKRLKRIMQIKEIFIFNIVFNDPRVKDLIIDLNTEKQLFDKGVDSKGRPLKTIGGDYAYLTKQIKSFSHQPFDRITLKDTGDFYRSFEVKAFNGNIHILADTIKDDDNLTDRWGTDILGLTEESKQKLIAFAKDFYIKELKKAIWK